MIHDPKQFVTGGQASILNENPIQDSGTELSKFTPYKGLVVVKRDDPARFFGKIELVNQRDPRKDCSMATVVKVGMKKRCPKTDRELPFSVEVGQRVAIDKYAGHDVSFDGVPHVVLAEDDIHLIREN